MIRTIALYLTLLILSIYSIYGFWYGMNGHTTLELLSRLPVPMAPANYVYLLWVGILVYTLVSFIKYRKKHIPALFYSTFQSALFICNSIVFCLVLYIWHQEQYMSAVILCAALLLLTFSLYLTYPVTKEGIRLRIPIAALTSWLLFLFVLMAHITLVRYEWSGFGLSNSLWTVIFLTVITIISLYLKYQYTDWVSQLVLVWFYIGITFINGFHDLLVSSAALFLSGVLLVGSYMIKKKA